MNKSLGPCPVCGGKLEVTELTCCECTTTMKGKFGSLAFGELSKEQIEFLKIFIKCKGSIKEVEKELDISYPTVRNKLEEIIKALGFEVKDETDTKTKDKEQILESVKKGEISAEEAIKLLRK